LISEMIVNYCWFHCYCVINKHEIILHWFSRNLNCRTDLRHVSCLCNCLLLWKDLPC